MTSTKDMMHEAFRRLKNADPEAFDLAIQVFDTYTIEAMQGLTSAPQDQILNMQGRAQQCQAFLRFMNECDRKKPSPAQPAPTDWMGV